MVRDLCVSDLAIKRATDRDQQLNRIEYLRVELYVNFKVCKRVFHIGLTRSHGPPWERRLMFVKRIYSICVVTYDFCNIGSSRYVI